MKYSKNRFRRSLENLFKANEQCDMVVFILDICHQTSIQREIQVGLCPDYQMMASSRIELFTLSSFFDLQNQVSCIHCNIDLFAYASQALGKDKFVSSRFDI